jgi:hypothetical protein
MGSVVGTVHVGGIRVNARAQPAGVALLGVRSGFDHLTVSDPHHYMAVLGEHVSVANAALGDLGHVVLDGRGGLVREVDPRGIEHLDHEAGAVEAHRALGLEVHAGLSAGGAVVVHVGGRHNAEAVGPAGAAHVDSADVSHAVVKRHLEGGVGAGAGLRRAGGGHIRGGGVSGA